MNTRRKMSQSCNNEDLGEIADNEININGSLAQELDDAYAYEYFRQFEPNRNYDRNASMPDKDSLAKSSNVLRQYCKERGLCYIRLNGIEQPARQIKEACKCRRLCYMKFLDDVRSKLLNNLLGLSASGQTLFLSSHITAVAVQRSRYKHCPRKSVHLYHLPSNSGKTRVCLRMFANTFDITDKKLRLLKEKIQIGTSENSSMTHKPFDDVTPIQSAANCAQEEAESEEGEESYRSHASIDFVEIPQMTTPFSGEDSLEPALMQRTFAEGDFSTDSVKSLPVETLTSSHGHEDSDVLVKTETYGEIEVTFSPQDFKLDPETEINENNSIATDEKPNIPALNDQMENAETDHNLLETMVQPEESDDDFLDQYFYRYVTNFGDEEPVKNKDKSMRKSWWLTDANETPSEPCSCVTFNCSSWLTNDLRQKMYTRYAGLSALNKKRFLYRHIRKEHKRRNNNYQSRRNFSMFYFVPTKKGYAKVCKVMFMNTFKVTDKKLRAIVNNGKLSDPSVESTTSDDHGCIALDPEDFFINVDENFMDDVPTDQSNSMIDMDAESCSSNHHSNVSDNATVSCNEDDKLHSKQNIGLASTNPKPRPVVELDDKFLDEYFIRYDTNLEKPVPVIGKPRKVWIKHDTSGEIMPPCSCLRKCYDLYPDNVRLDIYNRFAKLSTINQKRFLSRHIQVGIPHKRRVQNVEPSRRQKSWFYYLPAKSGYVKVCRVMFINTFKVTEKKLRHLVQRKQFEECPSDGEDQNAQYEATHVRSNSSCDDLSQDRTEGTAKPNSFWRANQISEHSSEEYFKHENSFAEVANSSTNILLSVLSRSVANRVHNDTSFVTEFDGSFLDQYFLQFHNNVTAPTAGIGLRNHDTTLPAPKILPPIACACVRKCHIKFPDELRQMMLDRYTALSVENRIQFMGSHVKKEASLDSVVESNSCEYCYYLPSKNGHVRVCNIMFLNTFNLNENELRQLCETGPSQGQGNSEIKYDIIEIKTEPDLPVRIKIENDSEIIIGDAGGEQNSDPSNSFQEQMIVEDRTCNENALQKDNNKIDTPGTSQRREIKSTEPLKISNVAIRFAKEHIFSFPRITSHYCQAINTTKYLSCLLDVTSMYIAYINVCTESAKEPVPSKIYTAILQKERSKDPVLPSTCDVCQYEENIDPGEDGTVWYEEIDE